MTTEIQTFNKAGVSVVRNAVSAELCEFITQYALFDEMQNPSISDTQSPNNHSRYADPAMETLLLKLQNTIEIYTNLNLFPTYSYYRVYRNGSYLSPHSDRESCEISATVCLNYSYSDKDYIWPIFIEGRRIVLKPGDLAIYKGIRLTHWRENFEGSDQDWHIQGFLHYVDQDGPYRDFKFDQRASVGIKRQNADKPYIYKY